MPDDTTAPSTDGNSRKITHGEKPAMAKQVNPEISVPNAATPSVPSTGAPDAATSFTPTTSVTEIAGLASTSATVT